MSMKVEVRGLTELEGKLKKNVTMDDVKLAVRDIGNVASMRMKAQTYVSFRKGYSHGATRLSIENRIKDGGLTAEVGPVGLDYPFYVEHGTRFMAAEPFVEPVYNICQKEFVSKLNKLFKF